MRELSVKIQNLITRVRGDRPGPKPQVAGRGDSLHADREVFEPQGLHFQAPKTAQGILLAPDGVTSVGVIVGLGGAAPGVSLADGEGGLHLLGTFKVYLAANGKLHLGQKDPTDFVALASLVDARISALETAFNAHVHTSAAPASPTSPPVVPLTPGSPTGSTEVKCL
jgi:hypothetical protein